MNSTHRITVPGLRPTYYQHKDVPTRNDIRGVTHDACGMPRSFPYGVDSVLQIPGFPNHLLVIKDGIGAPILKDIGDYPGFHILEEDPDKIKVTDEVPTTTQPGGGNKLQRMITEKRRTRQGNSATSKPPEETTPRTERLNSLRSELFPGISSSVVESAAKLLEGKSIIIQDNKVDRNDAKKYFGALLASNDAELKLVEERIIFESSRDIAAAHCETGNSNFGIFLSKDVNLLKDIKVLDGSINRICTPNKGSYDSPGWHRPGVSSNAHSVFLAKNGNWEKLPHLVINSFAIQGQGKDLATSKGVTPSRNPIEDVWHDMLSNSGNGN